MKLYQFQTKYLDGLPARAIMAADTGTGKTIMALAHYQKTFGWRDGYGKPGWGKNFQQPLLILAPASKVRTGDWEREITEYFGAGNEPEFVIYSYEKFSRNPTLTQFKKGSRAIWHQFAPAFGGKQWAVIADECHRIKNPQSGIGKAVYAATKGASFFVGLSATPLPNGWIDFANYSKIWGFTQNITEFKRIYCDIVTYKGFPEIRGYWHENRLTEQWQSISRKLDKREALDLPERVFIGVDFKRPATYLKMILERKDSQGEVLDTAPKLAHALRQTLTPGKIEYLSDLIAGTDENVVIFYNYVTERQAILEMLQRNHADRQLFRQDGEKHELPAKPEWPKVKRSITLAQFRAGGTGVEMTYATLVVYFSPTYSYTDYIQSIGRVHRHGQLAKTTFYNFRTPNTIEEDIYEVLKTKSDFQERVWINRLK